MLPSFQDYQCFVVCGKTDMRGGINSLAHRIQDEFKQNPFSKSLFIFCGGLGFRTLKILAWEPTGFYLIIKQINASGKGFKWPKDEQEALLISYDELGYILEGMDIFRRLDELKDNQIF
jgi:transposase